MPQPAEMTFYTLGDIKVTYLADGGGIVDPLALYPASTEAGWQRHEELLDSEGRFITSIGGYLIEIGDQKIAVDTGIGPVQLDFPGFGPFFGGKYWDSLKRTGVEPEAVTEVIFTHLHVDHVGWTTIEVGNQRQLTYPNARYLVTAAEWDFWHGGDNPAGPHPEYVQKPLEGRIEMMSEGDSIAPGLSVISTPGHTPGHVSLLITAGDQRLFLTADTLHGAMQLQERDWNVAFDIDPAEARRSREKVLPELAKPNTITAANHFSDQVFGRVVERRDGRLHWEAL